MNDFNQSQNCRIPHKDHQVQLLINQVLPKQTEDALLLDLPISLTPPFFVIFIQCEVLQLLPSLIHTFGFTFEVCCLITPSHPRHNSHAAYTGFVTGLYQNNQMPDRPDNIQQKLLKHNTEQ